MAAWLPTSAVLASRSAVAEICTMPTYQTAEMVCIQAAFYIKGLIFPKMVEKCARSCEKREKSVNKIENRGGGSTDIINK